MTLVKYADQAIASNVQSTTKTIIAALIKPAHSLLGTRLVSHIIITMAEMVRIIVVSTGIRIRKTFIFPPCNKMYLVSGIESSYFLYKVLLPSCLVIAVYILPKFRYQVKAAGKKITGRITSRTNIVNISMPFTPFFKFFSSSLTTDPCYGFRSLACFCLHEIPACNSIS